MFKIRELLIFIYPAWILFFAIVVPVYDKYYLVLPVLFMFIMYAYNQIVIKRQFYFNAPFEDAEYNLRVDNKLIVVFSIILIFLTSDMLVYYTGSNIVESVQLFLSGKSNYNNYQIYFSDNQRHSFEPIKIYYNILLAVIKLCAFYSVYMISFLNKRKIAYFFLIVPLVMYSLTRGTNVELFEIFIYFSIVFIIKYNVLSKIEKIRMIRLVLLFVALFMFLFFYQVQSRYSFKYTTSVCTFSFCYDSNYPFPSIGRMLFSMAPYFLGGLVNLYVYISDFSFLQLLPFNSSLSNLSMKASCEASSISCGPWKPVLITLIEFLGLFFTFIIYVLAPYLVIFINKRIRNQFVCSITLFVYLYFIYSSFIGGGVTTSYVYLLFILFVIVFFIKGRFKTSFRRSI